MNIEFVLATEPPAECEAIGVPVTSLLGAFSPATTIDEARCKRRGFKGKPGSSVVFDEGDTLQVLLGVGEAEAAGQEAFRRAGGVFQRDVQKCTTACFDLRGVSGPAVSAGAAIEGVVEGVMLAAHRFDEYKSEKNEAALARVVIATDDPESTSSAVAVARGTNMAEAVMLARDLIDHPAGVMTPRRLAAIASDVATYAGLSIKVMDEDEIAAERLGGLLGVAMGSAEPPRLVKLTYEPDPEHARPVDGRVPTVAIVGKGITFDSGGLSLKSGEGMMTMKTDMSGAAAVVATLGACRALGVGCRVVGIAPITENMPGGHAQRPGDVLTIRNGKTIEVLNTDAEGRLVLADGLCLATEEQPDAIIDIATLTGACIVALGKEIAGVMGNDDELIDQLREASGRAGEKIWQLPIPDEYRKDIDSEIADMKNIGKTGQAGTLAAALLLAEFVDDTPWAHLDIAGPARSENETHYLHKGATGFGVRTLLELVSTFEPTRGREDEDGVPGTGESDGSSTSDDSSGETGSGTEQ
jgi:leucyl aminopeptidase